MAEDAISKVARGSTLLLLGQLGSNVIALVAFVFIARGMTRAEMGVATITNLMIMLGVIVSGAGIPTTSIRFVSEARGKGSDPRPFVGASILSRTILALSYSTILVVFAEQLSILLFGSSFYTPLFCLAAFGAMTMGFMNTFNSILVGLDEMKGVCASYVISSLIGQSTAVLLIMYGWGVMGYVLGRALSGLVGSFVSGTSLIRALPPPQDKKEPVLSAMETLLVFSAPVLATNLANYVFACFDRFALVNVATQEELGMYSVAVKAYAVITMIPMNIAMALFPYYGEKYGRAELSAISGATRTVSRYLSLLYVPVALGLSATAEPVLIVFAGGKYAGSAPILMVFGFFGALTAFTPMMGYLLITYKKTKAYMAANLASVLCSLSLAPILIPRLGVLIGMSLVRGVALALLLAFYTLSTRRMASVDCISFGKALLGASLMAILVYSVQSWFQEPLLLPLYMLLGAVVYGLCMRLLKAVSYADVVFISSVFPRPLRRFALSLGGLIAHKEGMEAARENSP